MGVTQLKVKREEVAGEVMWPNPNVDDATFRRTFPWD
jgi:hypothetical protein